MIDRSKKVRFDIRILHRDQAHGDAHTYTKVGGVKLVVLAASDTVLLTRTPAVVPEASPITSTDETEAEEDDDDDAAELEPG